MVWTEAIKLREDTALLGWAVSYYHVQGGNPRARAHALDWLRTRGLRTRSPRRSLGKSSLESMSPRMWIRRRSTRGPTQWVARYGVVISSVAAASGAG